MRSRHNPSTQFKGVVIYTNLKTSMFIFVELSIFCFSARFVVYRRLCNFVFITGRLLLVCLFLRNLIFFPDFFFTQFRYFLVSDNRSTQTASSQIDPSALSSPSSGFMGDSQIRWWPCERGFFIMKYELEIYVLTEINLIL